jgi:hypothetical protein
MYNGDAEEETEGEAEVAKRKNSRSRYMTSAHLTRGNLYPVDAAMTRIFCGTCQGSVWT